MKTAGRHSGLPWIGGVCGVCACVLLAGCHTTIQTPPGVISGNFGRARVDLAEHMTERRSDRAYLLDRMRVGVLTLADGYPVSAQHIFENLYQLLRTQGINKDRTVASVVLYEGVKIWKGEPFEQALAMMYYGLDQAEQGSWDNARAAAYNSLFDLRDFGTNDQGQPIDTAEIARRSLIYERAIKAGDTSREALKKADYLDYGYVVHKSDFTLGYLLNAIANQQLGRSDEAADNFNRVLALNPDLQPLVEAFEKRRYNTVLVVAWGLGPRKVGYGPDGALARFVPRDRSDRAQLYVNIAGAGHRRYRQVLDVNTMAASHMWRALEEIRLAKSYLGTGLLTGGLIAADIGVRRGNNAALYGGLGALAAGMLMKAGAHADTRYCDVMPQRFYVVPLNITSAAERITLQVDNEPASRLVLTGLGPPPGRRAQLRYVSLVSRTGPAARPPGWATSGRIYYTNAYTAATTGPARLPYILGGYDVRAPSDATLRNYQQAGFLGGFTTAELAELFRLEGLKFTVEAQGGYAGRNVLAGGRSLVAPIPGTTGFAYLFGRRWPAYQPRSKKVQQLFQQPARQGDNASVRTSGP